MISARKLQSNCRANMSWVIFLRIQTRMESGARSASKWRLRRVRPACMSELNAGTTLQGNTDKRIYAASEARGIFTFTRHAIGPRTIDSPVGSHIFVPQVDRKVAQDV